MTRRKLLLGLAAVPAFWTVRRALRMEVIVANESGQYVHDLTVELVEAGRSVHFGDLSPGGSGSVRLGTPPDDDYIVLQGRLADGTPVMDPAHVYASRQDYCSTFWLFIRPNGTIDQRFN